MCQEERVASVSSQLELSVVEEGLREALDAAMSSVTTTHGAIENIATTETSLDNKIEKRQQDLERNHKRLQMLKKVRYYFISVVQTLVTEYVLVQRRLSWHKIFSCTLLVWCMLLMVQVIIQSKLQDTIKLMLSPSSLCTF